MEKKSANNPMVLNFCTSNLHKIMEISSILQDCTPNMNFLTCDLDEYQGDIDFICKKKCRDALRFSEGAPVVVEDTSLCFNALHGLPGPYIKSFYEKLGSEGLYKLLAGFEDKSASAICTLAFTEGEGKDVILFQGETKGTIVKPKGDEGFGWDSCFLPENKDKTYAEISMEEKNEISHRRKALNKLKLYLMKRQ